MLKTTWTTLREYQPRCWREKYFYSRIEATGLIMGGWKPARFRQKAMGGFGGGFCNVLIIMVSHF